jgi:hypothetical protein
MPVLQVHRASSSAAVARAASTAATASTSALATASSAIASLAAPSRRRCSLCRRSLAFLYRDNLGLLPVLRARGDRELRLSFGLGALVGGCYVRKRLPQMSCCSFVQERRDEQRHPVFLLSTED